VGDVSTYGVTHKVYHADDIAMISTLSRREISLEALARMRKSLDALRILGIWHER
jgi:hypothetical protein